MGAAALVVESAAAARERAITPICEVLGSTTSNSAFHGTRLDVHHIGDVMEDVVSQAERRGVRREQIAPETMFVSHETYTPARGGSAAAEIYALRQVFGDQADRIVIANTKGFTGHPMGVGIEDVVAVKALETGIVPPVPNFRDVDPDLGLLNLSRGGVYPINYALRLAAGFGSQISMTLMRWTPVADGRHRAPDELGFAYRIADRDAWTAWMRRVSGQADPQLEVVARTLRVVDVRPAVTIPAPAPVAAPAQAPAAAIPALQPTAPAAPGRTARSPPGPLQGPGVRRQHHPKRPSLRPNSQWIPRQRNPGNATRAGRRGRADRLPAPTCSTWTSTSKPTSASTPSSRPKCSPPSARPTAIERDDTLKLRDYPTLNHVVGFVMRTRTRTSPPEPAASARESGASITAAPEPTTELAMDSAPAESTVDASGCWPSSPSRPATRTDLLDLDLDLEADLGIDTVKQAEVFATIREAYGNRARRHAQAPRLPHPQPRRRLRHERAPDPRPSPPQRPAEPGATSPRARHRDRTPQWPRQRTRSTQRVLAVVAEQTGYPPDLLDLDLDLEADLGIDTVKQAEVFATIREAYGIERDDTLKLRDYPTLNHVVGFVTRTRTRLAPSRPEPAARPGVRRRPAAHATANRRRPQPRRSQTDSLEAAPAASTRRRARRRSCALRSTAACRPASRWGRAARAW